MRTVFDVDDPHVNPYRLMTALIVPRPIAWISSVSADGVANLAPHSFFSVACAEPPIVSWTSVGHKDTLANVLATREFVINLASEPMLEAINASSARFPADVDEAATLGITMEASEHVAPMRVADSPASIECRLHSTTELGDSVLVLGDVIAFTVRDDVLAGSHPEFERLRPLSRLGRDEWGHPPATTSIPRP